VLHMTAPDDRFSKVLFSQQSQIRPTQYNTMRGEGRRGPDSLMSGSTFNMMGGFSAEASRTLQTSDGNSLAKMGGSVTRATGVGSKLR